MIVYRGIVYKSDENNYYVIILDEFGYKFIPISDNLDTYKDLNHSSGSFCAVKFFDGTECVGYEYAIENSFENIFIVIEDFGRLSSPHDCLYETIRNDYDEITGLWEIIEEMFNEDEIKEKFENFKLKDFYGRPSTENSED